MRSSIQTEIMMDPLPATPSAVPAEEIKRNENKSLLGNFNRQVDLGQFDNMIVPPTSMKGLRRDVVKFYQAQNEVLSGLKEMASFSEDDESKADEAASAESHAAHLAIQLSFAMTFVLISMKVSAALYSHSIAIVASSVDSALDVLSQLCLLLISKALRKHDPYRFPVGRARLEPLGILVFAIIMGMAALFLLYESVTALVDGLDAGYQALRIDAITLSLLGGTILIQAAMFVYCRRVSRTHNNNAAADALAQDHLNDIVLNVIGGIPAIIAGYAPGAWFMDPVGAICISLYIGVRWTFACLDQIGGLVGKAAPREFVGKLTYLAATHDARIKAVDTVLAYHIGYRYQCEIHIVLDGEMRLRESHDIGESLQKKIESLPEVETAFVHMDYESDHKPEYFRRIRSSLKDKAV